MLKNTKRILPVFLAIAIVVCLFTGFTSAAALDTYTVSIYVQEAVRDENGDIDSTYVWVDTPIQVLLHPGKRSKTPLMMPRPKPVALFDPAKFRQYLIL